MSPRMCRRWMALFCAGCCLAGCWQAPGKRELQTAEQLVAERDWDAAIAAVKQYLVYNPYSAGGHLLLGQCYLHQNPPALDVAEGEFKTAMHLYAQTGEIGGIKVSSPAQFQATLHTEMAITYLRALYEALEAPASPGALNWLAKRSLEHTQKARSFYDSGYLEELENTLKTIELEPKEPSDPFRPQEEAVTALPGGAAQHGMNPGLQALLHG